MPEGEAERPKPPNMQLPESHPSANPAAETRMHWHMGCTGGFLSTSLPFDRASLCILHRAQSGLPISAGNWGFYHVEEQELGGGTEAGELGWRSRGGIARLDNFYFWQVNGALLLWSCG